MQPPMQQLRIGLHRGGNRRCGRSINVPWIDWEMFTISGSVLPNVIVPVRPALRPNGVGAAAKCAIPVGGVSAGVVGVVIASRRLHDPFSPRPSRSGSSSELTVTVLARQITGSASVRKTAANPAKNDVSLA